MLAKLARELHRAHAHAAAGVEYHGHAGRLHELRRVLEGRERVRRNRFLKRAAAILVEERQQVSMRLRLRRVNEGAGLGHVRFELKAKTEKWRTER